MKGPTITPEDRLLLLKTAVEGLDERIEVLDWEITRQGPSFTIDTVNLLLKKEVKPIVLILGDESFTQLDAWKSPLELLDKVDWIVVNRSHRPLQEIVQLSQQLLHKIGILDPHLTHKNCIAYRQDQHQIHFCEIDALPISSTEIRNKLGEMWKKNTLENSPQGIQRSVWLMIKEKRLYTVG